ncbi:MAG: molybdopterin molybdenumtransferase MoeA [Proteobacteria bacterium]|nr:molybdopterin molybdenumtransferase MoeA [Pseudomonadota bacterium]
MPFSGFFKVKTPSQIYPILETFVPIGTEEIALGDSLHRTLAEDVISPTHLPPFNRSTVDGYAVMARDTFGASESNPLPLRVVGEVLMGESTDLVLSQGESVAVPTGGIIPKGADSVMMVEFSEQVDEATIQVKKALSPLENVIERGEDIKKGAKVLSGGHRIRPQDLGVLAAFGKSKVGVYRRPRVSIVSSGDEIVDITVEPKLGEIRDVNRYSLSALIEMAGGTPLFIGIARDSFEDLKSLCDKGLQESDMLIVSGGSSVGTLDYTTEVIKSFPDSEIMVHGVSLRPGKPTIIARSGGKPVAGLPGHPVSAMVVFDLFMKPLIWRLAGYTAPLWPIAKRVSAILTRNVSSPPGREDYIRVRAEEKNGEFLAHPILGKSGSISTMVEANGLIKIDIDSEGLEEGTPVEVLLF